MLQPDQVVSASLGPILELRIARELFDLRGRSEFLLSIAMWRGGLPVDVLPVEKMMAVALGEDNFAWAME